MPGTGGISLYYLLRFFVRGIRDAELSMTAMAMAYRFFFALFPGLMLLFILMPYAPFADFEATFREFLLSVLPANSVELMNGIMEEFLASPGFGLISLNVFLLVYSALTGIRVMTSAFSKKSSLFRKRSLFRSYGVGLVMMFTLIMMFILMLGLIIAGEVAINYMTAQGWIGGGFTSFLLVLFEWTMVWISLQFGMSVVYYLGPPTTQRWPFFSPGSVVAGTLALFAIMAFRFFLTGFESYNKLYGSLSAIMILMLWFYWLSIVMLIGFELNVALARAKRDEHYLKGHHEVRLEREKEE